VQRLRPQLERAYEHIVVALPPDADLAAAEPLHAWPAVSIVVSPQPFWGRYLAIQVAIQAAAARVSHVHYADLDMLLHWIEVRPEEWRQILARIQTAQCLVTGRTERAFRTRPQAIQQTERLINTVFSHVLGQPVDLGLGSRGFSRRAAEFVVANSAPGGWGDAAWPVLLHRAGFGRRLSAVRSQASIAPVFRRRTSGVGPRTGAWRLGQRPYRTMGAMNRRGAPQSNIQNCRSKIDRPVPGLPAL
jgi:hypothetical protein